MQAAQQLVQIPTSGRWIIETTWDRYNYAKDILCRVAATMNEIPLPPGHLLVTPDSRVVSDPRVPDFIGYDPVIDSLVYFWKDEDANSPV
jgi:hypothetical protein